MGSRAPAFRNNVPTLGLGALCSLFIGGAVVQGYPHAYSDGPPPRHTGGFDEPTCRRCHFDQAINDLETHVLVDGVPHTYQGGQRYRITLTLHREALGRGGFQMAARYIGPLDAARQAGAFRALDDRVQVIRDDRTEIQYAQHTASGSSLTQPDTVIWSLEWEAPHEAGDAVVFHLAANAANGDASEFGDFVILRRLFAHAGG